MLKVLKRIVLSLLVVATLYVLALWSEVLPRPTPSQRDALAMMEATSEPPGEHNAFEFFWWVAYDIDASETATALQADIEALRQWQPADFSAQFRAPSRERYPRLIEADADITRLCDEDGACLAKLAADIDGATAALADHAILLRKLDGIIALDHWRMPFNDPMATNVFDDVGLRRPRWAEQGIRFLRGDTEGALAGVCGDITAWRRLRTRSDSLIPSLISMNALLGSLRLYSDMRARLPADAMLPGACTALQAPPSADERMSCDVFRGEFNHVRQWSEPESDLPSARMLRRNDSLAASLLQGLAVNATHTAHLGAERFALTCQRAHAPIADWPALMPKGRSCSVVARLFNPAGCILEDIARPALYSDYVQRDRDTEGALRLVALADWLARQDDPQTAIAAAPESLRDFEHDFALEGEQLLLTRLGRYGPDRQHWRIPLPGSAMERAE